MSDKISNSSTIRQISIAVDTRKMACWSATCYIISGFCYIYIAGATFVSAGNNQHDLITGLPKAKLQSLSMSGGSNAGETAIINSNGDGFWVPTGGTSLYCHTTANTKDRLHWIYLIYPVDE